MKTFSLALGVEGAILFLKEMRDRVCSCEDFRRKKNGKTHAYWALVESHRTPRGSRQRVVSYLGELQESEKSGWAQLSERLNGQGNASATRTEKQLLLFEPPECVDEAESFFGSKGALVDLKGVRLDRPRDFGVVWMAWGLWRLLELDELLQREMNVGREEVSWSTVAAILASARFCEPSSELHIETTWYRGTALDDFLGVPPEKVHTDRLYAGLDQLLPHKEAIETHLKRRLGELFELDYELMLYDVTSTYFEGQCKRNPLAKHGYSRDKRPDCLQVCIALVVTTDGIPLGYEVFAGNRHDSTTVEEIVETIEKKHGHANRIWVMDRGMVSEENLKFVRRRDGRYIVGTPKASLRKFEAELLDKDWSEVEPGVEVKLVPLQDGGETFILARSAERRAKEKAIHERFVRRLETGLVKLRNAVESGRLRDLATAERRLGRLQGEHSRAAKAFVVVIEPIAAKQSDAQSNDPQHSAADAKQPEERSPKKKAKGKKQPTLRVAWSRNEQWDQWAQLSEGCYLLRTNLNDAEPKTLWKQYIQLTDAEWAFRISKHELVLRPIWHHKEDRVKAHILVCFLAYAMWKTLAQWMRRSGLGDAPRTVLDELAKIKSADVVLPVMRPDGSAQQTIRLRCVTEPDQDQKTLLHRLGVRLPKRLGTRLTGTQM